MMFVLGVVTVLGLIGLFVLAKYVGVFAKLKEWFQHETKIETTTEKKKRPPGAGSR